MAGPEWNRPVSVRQNSDDTLVWGFAQGTISASTPWDFSSCTAVLTVKEGDESSSPTILSLTSDAGQITFGSAVVSGITVSTITATLTHDTDASLPIGTWYYDLLVTNSGNRGYFALGAFTVNPSSGGTT